MLYFVLLLGDYQADMDSENGDGRRPLDGACPLSLTKITRLLAYNADVNHIDKHGNTPLYEALPMAVVHRL